MAKVILTSDILNKREEDFRNENPYSFGIYYDLSDTSAEDLELKDITCDGDNDNDDGGLKNNVLDTTFYQKNNLWYVDILPQYNVSSEIIVTFTYKYIYNNSEEVQNTENITISIGNNINEYKLSIPENINAINIVSISCTPKNDETYKYIVKSTIIEDYIIYYGIRKYNTIDTLNANDVISTMMYKKCLKGDNEIEFSMPYIPIEGLNDMNEDEFNNVLLENAQDFVILYSDNVENYVISYSDAEIIDNDFVKMSNTLTIDGQKYNILVRSDYSAQSPIREPHEISENDKFETHNRIFIINN